MRTGQETSTIDRQAREPAGAPRLAGPGPEELASALDLMNALVKAAKALCLYLANNPMLVRFVEELLGKMTAHLARYGDFELDVEPFALRYRGAEVYQNPDPKESMAFRMHSDGIRTLVFSPGLEEVELTEFLEIAGFERPNPSDDDMVTRLWTKNLPHIAYLLEEDFAGIESQEEDAGPASQQEAISEVYRTLAATPLPATPPVPGNLLALSAEEAGWLRTALQVDARRNPLDDVISILAAILGGAQDEETFRDFTAIMAKLAVDMFLAREIGHALRLVRFLDQLRGLGSTPPERRQVIDAALAGVLCERVLKALQETVDGGDAVSPEELRELLMIFGLPCLGLICEFLGRVEKLKARKVVLGVLVELGRDNPEVFAPFLSDPRWYLIRNVVLVLSQIGDPLSLSMIAGLISHKEARIRKEVLGFLERSEDPKAKSYLLKFLRDESSSLRISCLQILAREKVRFALKPVLALTTGPDFRTRELAEKIAVYQTLGELGSVQMIPLFSEMLIKKQWFRRGILKENATCAVAGLLKVRHPLAHQVLLEAREQGGAEVRAIIDQAIGAVAGDRGTTAA